MPWIKVHATVLTEDNVVDAVYRELSAHRWVIESRALAIQRGTTSLPPRTDES